MKKLFLVLALFALSACSVGQKCTYTQDGTKISSYVWFTKEVPVDLNPIQGSINTNSTDIIDNRNLIADNEKSSAINEKEIELLKVQIEEIKVSTSNPLTN